MAERYDRITIAGYVAIAFGVAALIWLRMS
ncbi:hypothetical protein SAMN05216337_104520 [Bradyrhizobium brasilense]|uniref:Uncharacterized protein n=1 Tax=Bradyrhizobium brasilense TaxID=1419277 RepID=A0A1G7IGM6_9BRAD|nr:hypothetical protein [Bradyrhizobium sp. USDA 4541]SDF11748.1 hypothetical protein SAMN05216337_104520 [Bradyrhizobium brasilense]